MTEPPPSKAWFRFHYPPRADTFVMELRDPERIAHARRILSGEEKEAVRVMGTLVMEPAPYNPPWSFHLDPDSIQFFAWAIEVCDSGIAYIEEHREEVGGAFLPDNHWCPWGSELLEEVAAPASGC